MRRLNSWCPRTATAVLAMWVGTSLTGCGNSESITEAPAPRADVSPTDVLGVIVSMGSAISAGYQKQQMIDALQSIISDLNNLESSLTSLQQNVQTDYVNLLLQDDQDTYGSNVSTLQDTWVAPIEGAFSTLVKIAQEASQSSPNTQELSDLISDFNQYVESNKLDEAGNAIEQAMLTGPPGSTAIWGLGWQLARQAQANNFQTTLYTSNLSAQFQALTQGWIAILQQLELVLSNYYNNQEAGGKPPTSQTETSAADQLSASGIQGQIASLENANPKPIPEYVLVDPSTNLMWGNFGPLQIGTVVEGGAQTIVIPTATNSAGATTTLGDLVEQINGQQNAGWSAFPVGAPGKGTGPANSGLQINNWAWPNMYSWIPPDSASDQAFTEHEQVMFGGAGNSAGLMSQLLGNPGTGQSMMGAMTAVSTPAVFPNPPQDGCNQEGAQTFVWVYSNGSYTLMELTAVTMFGVQYPQQHPVGSMVAEGQAFYCVGTVALWATTTASDYAWQARQ